MFRFTREFKKRMNSDMKMAYCGYVDSAGNYLAPDDILFMDQKTYDSKFNYRTWDGEECDKFEGLTVFSEGVKLIYDDSGNFPIALKTQDGRYAYLKVSRITGEILPMHAGCCPVLSIIFVGPPSAAKTVSVLVFSDNLYHDMLVKNTNVSIWDDLPSTAPSRLKYEEMRRNFHNHILPEPTLKNESILPYCFYVEYGNGRKILLKLEDIDGEQCTNIQWESRIFHNNFYVLTIGADEIVSGNDGQYSKMINQLLPRLKVLRSENNYEVMVMITKSDCLDPNNVYLRGAMENSIRKINGKWELVTHNEGFDYETFNYRSSCVQSYIKSESPNFYSKLANIVPKQNLSFCMIASVGEQCKEDNTFKNYNPMFIDEPILSILAKAGVYPIAVKGEKPKESPVAGYDICKNGRANILEKFMEIINMDEEDTEVNTDEK